MPALRKQMTDLAFTPALEQARLIRTKEVSPVELVELYLQRIQQPDGQLGAFVTVMAEQAIADARAKSEMLTQNSSELPPFFGVPIPIKDLIPVAGVPCSYGVRALMDSELASYDWGIVTRLRQAGFIILGKTAASQLGTLPFTEPPGFPPTRNPWNTDYTSGGSSGGAATAVAAGLCPIAHGSDGGGSIRIPAACCGLVGLKPSRGRVSHAPVGDKLSGIAIEGPIARTVADAAAMLDAIAGYMTGDPYWLPDPEISFAEAARSAIGSLRIAFSTNIPPIGEAYGDYKQAVLSTVRLLEDLGHSVRPGCPDLRELVDPFTKVWQSGIAAASIPQSLLDPVNCWLLERKCDAGEYLQAVSKMQSVARSIVAFFDDVDVLLLPVYLHGPMKIGEWATLGPEEIIQRVINWIAPCPPFNATGQPAITIPVGLDSNGLPIGVQLVGRPAAETTIISLAAQIEAAQPWPDRPISYSPDN